MGDVIDIGTVRSEPDPRPPEFSDESLALGFSDRFADDLRYVAGWCKWLCWNGYRWQFDDTLAVFDRARGICRQAAAECNQDRVANTVASASTVAAVERLARSDRRHAATVEQFDRDPWCLNTPDGTVDLRTGLLHPADRDAYCTKATAVGPWSSANCPLWRAFLDRVFAGDQGLIEYIARVAGYSLTGSIREHALFFAHGAGRNGKGVLLNTLTGMLGDYAAVAAMETFTASTHAQHPTDLAMLRGARLVTAQETEENRRWAEAKVKALTGGDRVTARFVRQDFFTFLPQFKLLIAGNHKPGLRGVDEAIRARFNLIPFGVVIPPAERDGELPEKLKSEWPGILRWAIEGCLQWQRIRLAPPLAVIDATNAYLAEEDAISLWREECTDAHPGSRENTRDLFASWKRWAEQAGEFVGTEKRLSQALQGRGLVSRREPGTGRSGYAGIRLRRPDYSDDPRYGP